jgi:mRNA interferase MazF
MVDKLTTVRRSALGARIGRLSARELTEIERLVVVFLGLA